MSAPLIAIRDLRLEVTVSGNHPSLKRLLSFDLRSSNMTLIDIPNLDFQHGDKICVVGRNGNGKTTLMRLLARIYEPTHGLISGSYSPTTVLASGIGLDDDLNVLDNIKYAIFLEGGSGASLDLATSEILEFCEISPADALKQYKYFSTGFKSRISFAIATRQKPDVLLLDEVLGGGDEVFMQKAKHRLHSKIADARLAFVATHAPDEMTGHCNKLLYLQKGRVKYFGDFQRGLEVFKADLKQAKDF